MTYALIPDGYTLKKVTPTQLDAVNSLRSHDDFKTILANPATMQLIGVGAIGLATVHYLPAFIEALEERVGKLSDDFKEGINDTVNSLNPLNIVRERAGLKSNEELIAELERRAAAKKEGTTPKAFGL